MNKTGLMMKKSRMEVSSKASTIDSERKISKELFKLLYIFVLTALILQKPNAQPGDIPVFESDAFDAEDILMEFPEKDLYGNANTILLLDSVYEFEHHELFTEHKRCYYYYNDLNRIDSVNLYFYDKHGDNMNIMEIRTFNTDGKLKKLILFKPESYIPYRANSIIEEYQYKGENLVGKIEIRNRGDFADTTQCYYIYNELGKLVYDSTYYTSAVSISYYDTTYRYSWHVSEYSYDSLNRLESRLNYNSTSPTPSYYNPDLWKYSYDSLNRLVSILRYYSYSSYSNWSVEKYSYEETDTSLLTLRQYTKSFRTRSDMPPVIDTITEFYKSWYNYLTFNEEGQRTSMEVIYWSNRSGEDKRIRAEYEYTQQGKLLHAIIYLNWMFTKYEGDLMETSHIHNTYDEEGNLLVYEKTIYHIHTGEWMLFNRKEYFYTPVQKILGIGEKKFTALKLYPNPVQKIINIQGDFGTHSYYRIVNLAGIIISRGTVIRNTIDVSRLNPGFYMIVIETDSGLHTGKFAKY